jgi:hypothetical protein
MSASEEERLTEYLLAGWRAERERLVCGEFTFESALLTIDRDGTVVDSAQHPIGGADLIAVRFDRRVGLEEQRRLEDGTLASYIALSPTGTTLWTGPDSDVATIYSPDSRPYEDVNLFLIDARAFGYVTTSMIDENYTYSRVSDVFDRYPKPVSVTPGSAEGIFTIEYQYLASTATHQATAVERISLDERKGFGIVSHTLHFSRDGEQSPNYYDVRCNWEEANGVWIPTTVEFHEPGARLKGTATIHWKTVNECGAELELPLEATDLPDDTLVVDSRVQGGPPVALGTLGARRRVQNPNDLVLPAAGGGGLRTRTVVILAVNLVAVLILGGLAWRRRRSSQQPLK